MTYFPFTTNLSPLPPSLPSSPFVTPPPQPPLFSPAPSPSPSLSPSTRLPASEAKLHLINNGCCCLLHCWRRAGTLGNAGATFNWMGLLMRPAGETPSQRHPLHASHTHTQELVLPVLLPPSLLCGARFLSSEGGAEGVGRAAFLDQNLVQVGVHVSGTQRRTRRDDNRSF